MGQHFLLSAAARTLSVAKVAKMGEEEAWNLFRAIRWSETDGEPYCPTCGSLATYRHKSRKIFSCQACGRQFSVTSGTIFAGRLVAIAIFVNGAKGHSALQPSRDLDCQYKTAFVLAHKLREALGAETKERQATGTVEIDGAYFGGYVKPSNYVENRRDRRLARNQTGKRQVVAVMRERGGRTLPFVVPKESQSVPIMEKRIRLDSTSTPTRPMAGIRCTCSTRSSASTIRRPIRMTARPPTRQKASSRVFGGPRSACTTTSRAHIWSPMPWRWPSARIPGRSTMASSSC